MPKNEIDQCQPGPGFRINSSVKSPPPETIEQLRAYPVPDVSDRLNGLYTLDTGFQHFSLKAGLCGPTCTVRLPPGDNLMLHKALEVARPGDVLVVDAGGHTRGAVCGGMIAQKALHLGLGGLVIDGMVRDVEVIRELEIPVFARGIAPSPPQKLGPGEINFPVCCGGIVIDAGDVVVGDCNGLVAVRRGDLAALVESLAEGHDNARRYADSVAAGKFDLTWVDRILALRGFR